MLKITLIQPAAPYNAVDNDTMQKSAWRMAEQAVKANAQSDEAQLIIFPEYFNTMGLSPKERTDRQRVTNILHKTAQIFAHRNNTWLLMPVIEQRGKLIYNSAYLYSADGKVALRYDKTHITLSEREDFGLTAGDKLPVVQTPFGIVAIMTCYDVYFPEVAQSLSRAGANLILFPSVQRSDSAARIRLLTRARAIDSGCFIARCSYGRAPGQKYKRGLVHGGSCIVAPDGSVRGDVGAYAGIAQAVIDPTWQWERPRCGGRPVQPVRRFLSEDRRPELYIDVSGNTDCSDTP